RPDVRKNQGGSFLRRRLVRSTFGGGCAFRQAVRILAGGRQEEDGNSDEEGPSERGQPVRGVRLVWIESGGRCRMVLVRGAVGGGSRCGHRPRRLIGGRAGFVKLALSRGASVPAKFYGTDDFSQTLSQPYRARSAEGRSSLGSIRSPVPLAAGGSRLFDQGHVQTAT